MEASFKARRHGIQVIGQMEIEGGLACMSNASNCGNHVNISFEILCFSIDVHVDRSLRTWDSILTTTILNIMNYVVQSHSLQYST